MMTMPLFDQLNNPAIPLVVFDAIEGERRKAEGIALAADNRASLVVEARNEAVRIASEKGTVHADDVYAAMVAKGYGHHALRNAAGSVFRDRRFKWTGEWHTSQRPWAKSNLLRVWSLAV